MSRPRQVKIPTIFKQIDPNNPGAGKTNGADNKQQTTSSFSANELSNDAPASVSTLTNSSSSQNLSKGDSAQTLNDENTDERKRDSKKVKYPSIFGGKKDKDKEEREEENEQNREQEKVKKERPKSFFSTKKKEKDEEVKKVENFDNESNPKLLEPKSETTSPQRSRRGTGIDIDKVLSITSNTSPNSNPVSGPTAVSVGGRPIGTPFNFSVKVHVDKDFTWNEGQDPSEIFDLQDKLGEGAFGAVYRAVLKQTGFVLAIKEIRMSRAQKEQTTIEKEINMLKKCVHRNTVQYYGCCRKDDAIWILTDYCGLGSMSDILELLSTPGTLIPGSIPLKRETIVVSKSSSQGTLLDERFEKERTMMESTWCQSGLTEMEVAAIVGGALEGLKFLHDKGIIHRDLKCANILLTDNGEVKIADFGVSEQITKSMAKRNTVVGTPYWMAPEVITATDYGIPADIWSLGITVIELCDCVPPLCDLHPMRAMFQIPHLPPPTLANPEHHTPTILSFLSLCLQKDPSARATAADLLGHNFVKGFTGEQGVNGRKKVLYPRIFTWIQAVEKRRAERREKYSEVKKKEVELEVVKKVEGRDSSDEEDFRGAMKGQATIKGSAMNSKNSPGTMFVKDEDHNEMEVTNLGTMIVADDSSTSNATNGKLLNNDENAAIRAMFLNGGDASTSTTNKSPTSPTNQGLRRRQHLYSPPTRKRSPSSSSPTRARDNPNAPVTLEYLWSLIQPSIQIVTNPIVNMHYRAQSHPKVGPIYRIMSSTLSTTCSSVKYLITNATSSSPAPSRSSPSSPSSQQPELSLTTLRRAPLTVVTALTASLKYRSRYLWLNYGHHLIYATLLMAMWGYHGVTMRYWTLRVEQLEGELQRMQFLRERFGR